jgi:hypothetical protein
MEPLVIRREWAMPSADTFDIPVIAAFVKKYLCQSKISVDPFARNKRWATYTNDLNPETQADSHLEALDFIHSLIEKGVKADLVIFDPPLFHCTVFDGLPECWTTCNAKRCSDMGALDRAQKRHC